MRPLRNVIYIQTQNSWLHKDNENLVLKVGDETKARVPIHKLQGLVCFGQVTVSPYLMAHCAENGITITFLNMFGKYLARVEGPVSGNVLLRRTQHLTGANIEKSVAIARTMLTGKLYNQRYVIRRYLRDHGEKISDEKALVICIEVNRMSKYLFAYVIIKSFSYQLKNEKADGYDPSGQACLKDKDFWFADAKKTQKDDCLKSVRGQLIRCIYERIFGAYQEEDRIKDKLKSGTSFGLAFGNTTVPSQVDNSQNKNKSLFGLGFGGL